MKRLILIASVCAMFTACGKKHDPIDDAKEASKDRDLQGKNFASACQLKALDAVLTGLLSGGNASIKGALTVYRFDGSAVTRTTRLFASTDCSGDTAISFEESGSFDIQPNTRTADMGKNIDINYTDLKVTTVTAEGATAANAVHLCGAADWSQNSSRNENGASADVNCYAAQVPRHNSNIYRVDANVLYLGPQDKANNGASDRPSALDMNDKYTAQ